MAKVVIHQADLPKLGTREAALRGCVDLIARMCGKPEHVVGYWLDLYFQTRLAYQVEEHQRQHNAELFERIPRVFGTTEGAAQPAKNEAPAETKAGEPKVAEQSVTPPPTGELTVEIGPAGKPSTSLSGFEPIAPKRDGGPFGNHNAADAAKFKRETAERLREWRAKGLTIAGIVHASRSKLDENTILDILGGKRVPIDAYRLLSATLDHIKEDEDEIQSEGGITRT